MSTHKNVDKARLDGRNLADGIRKDVDAVVSDISTGIKKARADLAHDVNRRRDRNDRRRSGQ